MYVATVVTLLFVLPVLSIGIECSVAHAAPAVVSIGKWYVFWAVGIRLLLAGLRQIFQPSYTAQVILGIEEPSAHFVVRELGIANCAMGVLGTASLMAPGWMRPTALAGCIFYGLAGINHALHSGRGGLQNMAMSSDLVAGLVLGAVFVLTA